MRHSLTDPQSGSLFRFCSGAFANIVRFVINIGATGLSDHKRRTPNAEQAGSGAHANSVG
jgi:hypothetical protein